MRTENNIEDEINKTLNSLDGVSEVKVSPYFYTRLSARMKRNEIAHASIWNWSIAAIVLMVLVNVVSLINISTDTEETVDVIDLMASEYSLKNDDLYNTELE